MKLKRKALNSSYFIFPGLHAGAHGGPAGAATGYSVLSAPNVDDDTTTALGTVFAR